MSDYVIMFPADDEAAWEASTDAERQAVYDVDAEFGRLLEARGGAITGGAELASSRRSRTIRRGEDGTPLVTDGPYAESVEQISGFYRVTCDDPEALAEAAQVLTRAHRVVEIRPVEGT